MRIVIAIFLFIVCVQTIVAQEYSFVEYSVKDGLPQTQVYALEVDESGYLWCGTAGGAGKFNGTVFQNYSADNGLLDNVVKTIFGYNSCVWVFTNTGISCIRGKHSETIDLKGVLNGYSIATAAVRHQTNSIIIATSNGEIFELPIAANNLISLTDVKQWSKEISFSNIRHFCESTTGDIWVASNGLFGYFDMNNVWHEANIEGSSHNVSDIVEDQNHNYYISVYGEGVYYWKDKIIKHYKYSEGLVSEVVRKLFIDSQGKVWAASKNGVSIISNNQIETYTTENGLPNNNIETFCEDREGNIWLGSDGSGVFRFTSDEFVNYFASSGIGSDYVMSIVEDSSGGLWFGTYGNGLTYQKEEAYLHYNLENGALPNNIVWASLNDSQYRTWFGTSGGLSKIDGKEITNYLNESWLPSNKITALYEDIKQQIWVGTSKGVAIIAKDTILTIRKSATLKLKNVRVIAKGSNNLTWLGTSNGVFVSDGAFFEPWIFNDVLKEKIVYSIANYKDSVWFVGTSNGMYMTNGLTIEPVELHESFGANYINYIGVESESYLWVGTNFGIFEIDLKRFFKDRETGILHHKENSGLASYETNLNAFFEDSKGKVWMGTGKGLIKFDRSKRKTITTDVLPQTTIQDVQLFFKSTDWSSFSDSVDAYTGMPKDLSLNYKQNYITFNYEGLSLSHPDEIRYKLKLEGLDADWTPSIHQNTFTYPNLSYGNYVFKVKSSIDGSHWSPETSFEFEVRKPYYLTWWFLLICIISAGLLAYIIIERRKKVRLQKRKTEQLEYKSKLLALEQQSLNASMNRHFIFNALNSIQYYINTKDRLSANKYLTSFAKLIRKNLDSSVAESGMVTLADELERLELYISLEGMRFQEKFTYKITVDETIDQEYVKIPAMILQPFVENSIWHGLLPKEGGGELSVQITKKENYIIFKIVDDGIGFDISQTNKTDNTHDSKGMLLTSNRLEILKKVSKQNMTISGPKQLSDAAGNVLGTAVEIRLEVSEL